MLSVCMWHLHVARLRVVYVLIIYTINNLMALKPSLVFLMGDQNKVHFLLSEMAAGRRSDHLNQAKIL